MDLLRTKMVALLALLVAVGCGGNENGPEGSDAGGRDGATDSSADSAAAEDGASTACTDDAECQDELFCNGRERCAPGDPEADARGCIAADQPACVTGQTCEEDEDRCRTECADMTDADGDGHDAIECGGDDCDDGNAGRFPGNPETCDEGDIDEDCDPTTYGERDADSDGFVSSRCCNVSAEDTRTCGPDCDDGEAAAHPTEAETCDGIDNDCDGNVDEGVLNTYYEDGDGDGRGSDAPAAMTMQVCNRPEGYADSNDDCDDGEASVHPGHGEICDALDNNCNDEVDETFACIRGDTRDCQTSCDRGGTETCNTECNWSGTCVGNTSEVCNTCDDDGDGDVNEGVTVTCWPDGDGDTFAGSSTSEQRCACDGGWTMRNPAISGIDCDDGNDSIHPLATELCDGAVDSNCDGFVEDADGDGHGPIRDPATGGSPPCSGGDLPMDDCHDGNALVHPGALPQDQSYECAGEYRCPCSSPDHGCVPELPSGACPSSPVFCNFSPSPTFDYNCDGADIRAAVQGDQCTCNGEICRGYHTTAYIPQPRCGQQISYNPCTGPSGCSSSGQCIPQPTRTGPLPCY